MTVAVSVLLTLGIVGVAWFGVILAISALRLHRRRGGLESTAEGELIGYTVTKELWKPDSTNRSVVPGRSGPPDFVPGEIYRRGGLHSFKHSTGDNATNTTLSEVYSAVVDIDGRRHQMSSLVTSREAKRSGVRMTVLLDSARPGECFPTELTKAELADRCRRASWGFVPSVAVTILGAVLLGVLS